MSDRSERSVGSANPPLIVGLNIGGLVLLLWGISSELRLGSGHVGVVALTALTVASLAWLGRLALWSGEPSRALPLGAVIALLGAAGGVLAGSASLGVVFVGFAAFIAAMRFRLAATVAIAAVGLVALSITAPVMGRSLALVWGGVAAVCGGAMLGVSRRQSTENAEREARLTMERERAELERARAEVLAERNRLARDIHDVLAHTLSALSVKLEALNSVLASEGPLTRAAASALDAAGRLVRDGLGEARQAVRALRDDARPLPEQLDSLCQSNGAFFRRSGVDRRLSSEASVTLYRVAQESLTNVLKHAPGARASVLLELGPNDATLTVENPKAETSPSTLASSGGGYGLQGIRERVLLLDGRIEVGPTPEGWRVVAWVPA